MISFSVLMIIERFSPLVGGAERQCFQLSEELARRGVKVIIATKRWQQKFSEREKFNAGFTVFRLGIAGSRRLADYVSGLKLFIFMFRKRRQFNLVYLNGGAANIFGSTAILAGKVLSKPVIVKIETPGELFFSGTAALSPKKTVHPLIKWRLFLARQADAYIAQTGLIKDELIKFGIAETKIYHFSNSVDTIFFKPADSVASKKRLRHKLGLGEEKIIVLYCGRLVKRKGLEYLISAWEKLGKVGELSQLLIIGSGKNQPDSVESSLVGLVRQKGLTNILFTGEKQKEELIYYLQAADLFVYPSVHDEGTALSVLEALSCGLPAIVSRVTGLTDIIEDNINGLLTEKENPQSINRALNILIVNKEKREKMAVRARQAVVAKYDNLAIAGKYYDFFTKLLG